jgi:hypothetical protein
MYFKKFIIQIVINFSFYLQFYEIFIILFKKNFLFLYKFLLKIEILTIFIKIIGFFKYLFFNISRKIL